MMALMTLNDQKSIDDYARSHGFGLCEVCGKQGTVMVQDFDRFPSDSLAGYVQVKPFGNAHYFCAEHERPSMEFGV
jgi:hypothetical protein